MQPCMKKKKSVTQLTVVEDFADKASKYCLRTQEQDSEGEIETRLYKVSFLFIGRVELKHEFMPLFVFFQADVVSTVGGGAQVVFNDVEVLRQESPTGKSPAGRKRPSSTGLLSGLVSSSPFRSTTRFENDNDETDTAARCKQGIGSSSSVLNSKRNRPA